MDIRDYRFIDEVKKLPFVESIWLFGSRAKGTARPTSDIDIAVTCTQATSKDWLKICEIIDRADTLLNIDCIRYDTLEKDEEIKRQIMESKVPIYEKSHPRLDALAELKKILLRFEEARFASHKKDPFIVDAVILRYNLTFELFWKVFQKLAQAEGVDVNSPRSALKAAYSLKWVENETLWLQMLEDRNLATHLYKEALASEVYERTSLYLVEMKNVHQKLEKEFVST